jgi:hypothetical protein
MHFSWDDWSPAILTGRGYNQITRNYDGSILPASGQRTYIYQMLSGNAMYLTLSVNTALAGEWIVLDYRAQALGTCRIGVFADSPGELPPGYHPILGDPPSPEAVWIQALSFNHVPSRDFDSDSLVNFADFALWASQWRETIAADPNMAIPGDLNADETVNVSDLALFCDFWLERTDLPEPACEPNIPDETL